MPTHSIYVPYWGSVPTPMGAIRIAAASGRLFAELLQFDYLAEDPQSVACSKQMVNGLSSPIREYLRMVVSELRETAGSFQQLQVWADAEVRGLHKYFDLAPDYANWTYNMAAECAAMVQEARCMAEFPMNRIEAQAREQLNSGRSIEEVAPSIFDAYVSELLNNRLRPPFSEVWTIEFPRLVLDSIWERLERAPVYAERTTWFGVDIDTAFRNRLTAALEKSVKVAGERFATVRVDNGGLMPCGESLWPTQPKSEFAGIDAKNRPLVAKNLEWLARRYFPKVDGSVNISQLASQIGLVNNRHDVRGHFAGRIDPEDDTLKAYLAAFERKDSTFNVTVGDLRTLDLSRQSSVG